MYENRSMQVKHSVNKHADLIVYKVFSTYFWVILHSLYIFFGLPPPPADTPSEPEPDIQIGFNMTEYTVQESEGSVTVTVGLIRFSREFPPLSLFVVTENGSATGT